jgi:response regulator RpfG family c-di-GMP phosphodiesterase
LNKSIKILFAEDNQKVRSVLTDIMSKGLDCSITEVESGNSAIQQLKNDDTFDLVISDYYMPNGDGAYIYEYLANNCPVIPFILITSEDIFSIEAFSNFFEDNPGNAYISKPINAELLIKKIITSIESSDCIDIEQRKKDAKNQALSQQMVAFAIEDFHKINISPCDVFLKLPNKNMVKVIHSRADNVTEVVMKYQKRNVTELYIRKEDKVDFIACQMGHIVDMSKMEEDVPLHIARNNIVKANRLINKHLVEFGMHQRVAVMTEVTIEQTVSAISKASKRISDILEKMKKKGDYLYGHGLLTAHIASAMAVESSYESRTTVEKLCTAAVLHDITVKNPEIEASGEITIEILDRFRVRDIEEYKKHPHESASILVELDMYQPDIERMIVQHHERPDGKGFPAGLTATHISPLACYFILAHDCAQQLYRCEDEPDQKTINDIKKQFEEKYLVGNFKAPCEIFLNIFSSDL